MSIMTLKMPLLTICFLLIIVLSRHFFSGDGQKTKRTTLRNSRNRSETLRLHLPFMKNLKVTGDGTLRPCYDTGAKNRCSREGVLTMTLTLNYFPEMFAVCRMASSEAIPTWATQGSFFNICRSRDELSLVCEQSRVPEGTRFESDWRLFQVLGPLPFELTGILAALTAPLAASSISIFAISTFDTDYLLVKARDFDAACASLGSAGISIHPK